LPRAALLVRGSGALLQVALKSTTLLIVSLCNNKVKDSNYEKDGFESLPRAQEDRDVTTAPRHADSGMQTEKGEAKAEKVRLL
jgi:hypothetical protein